MPPPIAHAPSEIAVLEAASALQLAGYLAAGAPVTLLPILAHPRPQAARRALVGRLNGRQLARVEGSAEGEG